jgi:hypothetical protein
MADLRGRSRGDLLPHAEVPHLRAPAPPGRALAGLQASGRARLIRRVWLPGTWPFPGGWVGEVKACCAVKGFTGAGCLSGNQQAGGNVPRWNPWLPQFRAACLMMRYDAAATPFGWKSRRRGSGRSALPAGLRGGSLGQRAARAQARSLRMPTVARWQAVPAEPHLPADHRGTRHLTGHAPRDRRWQTSPPGRAPPSHPPRRSADPPAAGPSHGTRTTRHRAAFMQWTCG